MPRRRDVPKRKIIPDPKYKDKLVTKFTNCLMLGGKKSIAEGILYGAFDERRIALAMRWLVSYSRGRGEKTMRERLAAELVDASQLRGNAVKKKDDTHKMAEANKAFAHYRW